MHAPEISVGPAESPARFLATDALVWANPELRATVEQQLVGVPADQRFAAEIDGSDPTSYPGVYGVYPMTLGLPDVPSAVSDGRASTRNVPCAGLSWVGVHPDHRRRGVLTAMMRHHVDQVHQHPDVHVSALHASEPAIYGRYGYGLASLEHEVVLDRGTSLNAPHLDGKAAETRTRLGSVSDDDVPRRMRACHLATATPGTVVGAVEYYERICWDPAEQRGGKEPWRVLFADRGGEDTGFAMFRRKQRWDRGRPGGELFVWSLVGDPAARLALLRRLLDFDLMSTVKLRAVGLDDPVLLWVGGPRSTDDVGTSDSLWVRLVDLPEALEQRAWSRPCRVVVDVDDAQAPWNDGTWLVEADSTGGVQVQRSTEAPDLRLPVAALGAAYLGGRSLVAMTRAGHLVENRAGAAAELWSAMCLETQPDAAWMF